MSAHLTLDALSAVWERNALPEEKAFTALTERTLFLLQNEDAAIRPAAADGSPGGFVDVSAEAVPSVLIPDLHGRGGFLLRLLGAEPACLRVSGGNGAARGSLFARAADGSLNLVFLGDAFHSESRGRTRWQEAHRAFLRGRILSPPLLAEMRENFSLAAIIMLLKNAFPQNVHFLKGNHENIRNADGGGNFPFVKFADEGRMTECFTREYYGAPFLSLYSRFESALPVFLRGRNFLASHAEPARFFSQDEVINARCHPEVVYGLTWTDNGEAEEDAVPRMLAFYLPDCPDALYFGGHRPVSQTYALRARGKFVQIHNPAKQQAAVVFPDEPFSFSNNFFSV